MSQIEVVPAILHSTFETIKQDWEIIQSQTDHIQIDITDGIFAGDQSFRDIRRLKQLVNSHKVDLHLMVHNPGQYVDDVIDLNPARCVFHIEAFADGSNANTVVQKLRSATQAELGLAINPSSPLEWLEEHLATTDFVLFMAYNPGWANQPIDPAIYTKLATFHSLHESGRIAIDGHVNRETVKDFVTYGATILYANTSIFASGSPQENLKQLQLLANAEASK